MHICAHTGQLSGIGSLHLPWVPGLELKSSVTAVSERLYLLGHLNDLWFPSSDRFQDSFRQCHFYGTGTLLATLLYTHIAVLLTSVFPLVSEMLRAGTNSC